MRGARFTAFARLGTGLLPPGPAAAGCDVAPARVPLKAKRCAVASLIAGAALLSGSVVAQVHAPAFVTLSIVGTTDLHGSVFERSGRGGLALFGGYVKNLRAARAADGGAVLLVDAGDTYQGGIESNLTEGALVVDVYNAMGYTAAAIGNHEFDFGPVDLAGRRRSPLDDPRGALKAIAARAKFPVLAANLLDDSTGRLVDWPNVAPSMLTEAAGVKVGIVGVMTIEALRATLVVNTRGLRVAPLAPAIAAEASKLRAAGAQVVIVASHAGGNCRRFDDPSDLSSCDDSSEIFAVARALPPGLVDAIVAGHSHAGLAHKVNGIAITQSFAGGRAFGRIDVSFDKSRNAIAGVRVFAPRDLCANENPNSLSCDAAVDRGPLVPARYEGRAVSPDPAIVEAMKPQLEYVRTLQATPLGVYVDTPLRRAADPESPLGNLFADAMRLSVPGADVAINNSNAGGGLRADLPPGPLTFGLLYDIFPFDNQVARLSLKGAELTRVLIEEIERGRRGALGISGIRVRAECTADRLQVEVFRSSGQPVRASEPIVVATTDMLASGAVFSSVAPPGGFALSYSAPVVREVVSEWIQRRGGTLSRDEFADPHHRRWDLPATLECAVQ
jgi:5'-nucleotidase